MEKTETIHVRINAHLKKALKKAAEVDNRSMSSAVSQALTDYVVKMGVKK